MPLPIILGVGAAVAGLTGVGVGIHGAVKMKEAQDTMDDAKSQHEKNIQRFENQNTKTAGDMDALGKLELEILSTFQRFADLFELIQNRPQFKEYNREGVSLPEYDPQALKDVSVGAGVLLGGLGGAALGTAGGFAAAGATTAAVMALGTASTGTAIATLSGAAATNAALAALGGGAIAAGGGGIALGTTILGAATLGVGLLVGGVVFGITGGALSDQADEAYKQMKKSEKEINRICTYLRALSMTSKEYLAALKKVNTIYQRHLDWLETVVKTQGKLDWFDFTEEEQRMTENTVLLVALLYKMCQVQLVEKAKSDNELNSVNRKLVSASIRDAEQLLNDRDLAA